MEQKLKKVHFRISKKGVPHTLIEYRGHTFSVCYFGKSNIYRIFLYDDYQENSKLLDIELSKGGSFNIQFVLDGLMEKYNLNNL